MNKNIYALCYLSKDNYLFHFVYKTSQNNNLLTLKNIKNIYFFNVYPKEEAFKLCKLLNEDAKAQGRLSYDIL